MKILLSAAFTAALLLSQAPPGRGERARERREAFRERMMKNREGSLKPGDPAPDFTLARLHSSEKVTLSAFRDKRPVALIFGSYT